MPDITMCVTTVCPKRETCYRYRAIASHRQSWANFYAEEKDCARFWDIKDQNRAQS